MNQSDRSGAGDRRNSGSRSRGQSQSRRPRRPRDTRSAEHRPSRDGRRHRVSEARLVAYDVLRDVEDRDAYANLALAARIREARLDGRDAALATELTAGTLRGRGRYDRIIEIAAERSRDAIDTRTLNVLRLGAHQLLAMRVASHAAVNESVELQRIVANPGGSGFVNGVLRTIERSSNEVWDERITELAQSSDEALAARSSHPAWILRALKAALRAEGRESELEELLAADNRAPLVGLALLPGSGIDVETAAAISGEGGLTATGPSPLGLQLAHGDPVSAIHEVNVPAGTLRVQDQGSQLAALVLTRARPVRAGEQWLDLCAGPGGKTAVLAAEAGVAGATVRANEVSAHRVDLVRDSVEAFPEVVEIVQSDGREEAAFGGQQFDRILVDAPCSGLGALRRRPEARWRKMPSDLPELVRLQSELLDAAVAHLAPGGLLAYVTCSPHQSETLAAIKELEKRHPELQQLDAAAVANAVTREPLDLPDGRLSVQLWPHRHGTDAMFIALFTRPTTAVH